MFMGKCGKLPQNYPSCPFLSGALKMCGHCLNIASLNDLDNYAWYGSLLQCWSDTVLPNNDLVSRCQVVAYENNWYRALRK